MAHPTALTLTIDLALAPQSREANRVVNLVPQTAIGNRGNDKLRFLRDASADWKIKNSFLLMKFRSSSLLFVAALAGTGAMPVLHAAPSAPVAVNSAGEYVLGVDDVLEINVRNFAELNNTVTVRPDGKISMPRAGTVVASGKTTTQLAREIQARLSKTLNYAYVQIVVKQARAQQARIIGAVKTVGTYDVKNGMRLMDLVAQAGGLNTKPNRVSGRLIRAGQVSTLNVASALKQPDGAANLVLKANDLVVLDAADYSKQITVMGEIAKPGAYDLDEDLTVMALMAQAGGPTDKAALRQASVLRAGVPVLTDLSDIRDSVLPSNSALSRFKFEAGDVLSVPENNARFGVMGQVAKPAYYPLPEDSRQATVLQALSQAGGEQADGDLSQASITRVVGAQSVVIPVDVAAMRSGQVPDTMTLQNGDILLIPKRKERKVNVIGQVARPGTYDLSGDSTLLSLLADAGNPLKGAGLSRSYVLRNGTQIPIDLRDAVLSNRPSAAVINFKLQPDDVLVIRDVSDQIQVIGQVAKPGVYDLSDDLTIMSLLAKTGSPTDTAALSGAYVLRDRQAIAFDLRSTLAGNIESKVINFRFEPGDVLVIPENQQSVGVLGQVVKPGYYPFPENPADATILKVLSTAGGPILGASGANLGATAIIRTIDGKPTVIPIKLDDMLRKGQDSDMKLLPGDVLYLPTKKKGLGITDLLIPLTILRGF